jgi:DNA-directed RNA polymerase-3 subunit RPC5
VFASSRLPRVTLNFLVAPTRQFLPHTHGRKTAAPPHLIALLIHRLTTMDYLDDDDDDPVVAEYDVYITGDMPEEQLYMLQYLNRAPDQPLTQSNHNRPSEVRIKQDAGFIEVDVPMDIHQNYNRPAGVRWGESLRKTKGFGQQAYGIASGFERTMPRATNRSGGPDGTPAAAAPTAIDDDDNLDEYVNNFEDANEKGHVLNTQTYGGQIIKDDGKGPSYMVGTFRDSKWCRVP